MKWRDRNRHACPTSCPWQCHVDCWAIEIIVLNLVDIVRAQAIAIAMTRACSQKAKAETKREINKYWVCYSWASESQSQSQTAVQRIEAETIQRQEKKKER